MNLVKKNLVKKNEYISTLEYYDADNQKFTLCAEWYSGSQVMYLCLYSPKGYEQGARNKKGYQQLINMILKTADNFEIKGTKEF